MIDAARIRAQSSISNLQSSIHSFADEPGEVRETPPRARKRARDLDRLLDLLLEHRARTLDAPDRRKRDLAGGRVLARRFAERGGVGLDVQQVVLDLEGEADGAPVRVEALEVLVAGEGEEAADGERGPDQAAGLALVDPQDQIFGVRLLLFLLQVRDLAADHAGRADRFDDRVDRPDPGL